MSRHRNRVIKLSKAELITAVEKNRELHIEEYAKAKIAYKAEALKQLQALTTRAESGEQSLKLQLTEPVDNLKHYDRILEMLEWEIDDVIELTEEQFDDYVRDEAPTIMHGKMLNQTYM